MNLGSFQALVPQHVHHGPLVHTIGLRGRFSENNLLNVEIRWYNIWVTTGDDVWLDTESRYDQLVLF
jgi:hypothetical protein